MRRAKILLMFVVGLLTLASPQMLCAQSTTKHQWTGTTPAAAAAASGDEAVIFLLNVGKYNAETDRNGEYWLGRGGRWGTQTVIDNTPMRLTFTKSSSQYYMQANITGQGATSTGYVGLMDGTSSTSVHDSLTYFADRPSGSKFTFNETGTKNVYTIVCTITTGYMWNSTYKSVDYKMVAARNAEGTDVESRIDCINAFKSSETFDDATDQWMLVSLAELKEYFEETDAASADPAIATFLLRNPDAGRKDVDIEWWEDEKYSDLKYDYPTAVDKGEGIMYVPFAQPSEDANTRVIADGSKKNTYTLQKAPNTYFVGNGFTADDDIGQKLYGDKWSLNILGNGKISQPFTPLRAGWYVVHVKAFCTEEGKAKLFASYNNASSATAYDTPYAEVVLPTSPAFGDTVTFYQGDSLLKVGEYDKLVMVYVPAINEDVNGYFSPIYIGIEVSGATDEAWTCIDNFQVFYHGHPSNVVLLDENRTDIDYINAQNTSVNNNKTQDGKLKKSRIYLRRAMNAGKWNSLVLPFDAPQAVIAETFGDGTVVSELKGAINEATPNRIYFQQVKDIKAGKLYIIKPTNTQPAEGNKKVESSAETKNTPVLTFDADSAYWTFSNVSFGQADDFVADFASDSVAETMNGGQVCFAGTYVNHGDELYIPAKSYVIAYRKTDNAEAGKWYYRTVGTKTKGFRGWLQVVEDAEASAESVSFSINGVVVDNSTTEIEGLTTTPQVRTQQNGVYNLNGQLVRKGTSLDGLAKGIYLVGGKKHIVN